MRLATLEGGERSFAAVVREDGAVRVGDYPDVGALLRDGEAGLEGARRAADAAEAISFERAELLCPVTVPGAIVCVGLNYRSHILEMGRELPEHPTLFAKLPRALTDPYAEIEMPARSDRVDYEAELGIVIGATGRDIAPEDAHRHVAGYTIVNDVTARDFQKRTLQWFAGKTFQASTPVGPWLVTPDELGALDEREISLTVNGEERQRSNLGDLVFGVADLIADLSRIVKLEPGDLIATGTPGGVGEALGRLLEDGDVVAVTIDGVGTIESTFRSRRP
jgi:acylpyruvate hydrolase